MLSNIAVPKYYEKFRRDVINGLIPICKTIEMEMNRIDRLIADPNMYFDNEAVEGWIRFCEGELTLTDGSDLILLDTFKLWGEQVYGWYEFVPRSVYVPNKDGKGGHYVNKQIKKRLIQKQYLIIPRRNAKSMYASCHQAYGLVMDTSTTYQVVSAPTMRQADEIMSPIRTAITRSRGPLFKFLTLGSIQNTTGDKALRQKLCSTKKGIENFLTNSMIEVRPMSIDKLQGLRNKYSAIDEWLSGDIREDIMTPLEQGASKIGNSFILATSSEGTVRNSIGDDIKIELMNILKGDYNNPHVSIWWYQQDDIKEVGDPELWRKSNPNLGFTVHYETIQQDVERAENAPSARNDILAKIFDIPMEGYTYFFTYTETLRHKFRSFWGMPCAMGGDLSQGDDFCAFTFLFPLRDGSFGIKARSYITEKTLYSLPLSMREKYDEFINEGSLIVMPGIILKPTDVYDDLLLFINNSGYDVRCFGYDPYGAKEFVELWEHDYSPFGVVKVPQGAKTESIPLGELKKLAENRMLLFDELIMMFCMGNAIALKDTNNNKKLSKKRADMKIDNVSAMLDAFVAYKLNLDMFE